LNGADDEILAGIEASRQGKKSKGAELAKHVLLGPSVKNNPMGPLLAKGGAWEGTRGTDGKKKLQCGLMGGKSEDKQEKCGGEGGVSNWDREEKKARSEGKGRQRRVFPEQPEQSGRGGNAQH